MGAGIAIIGMSCRFPGAAGVGAFWDMLTAGRRSARASMPVSAAQSGSIPAIPEANLLQREPLDAAFFDLSNAEANAIGDAHRLGLELAVEALDDAGIPLADARGTRTAVFTGAMWHQTTEADRHDAGLHTLIRRLSGAISGRIAHHLDLRGPAVVVDTATSSALVAVHLAAQCIRLREAPMALAGGINFVDPASSAALTGLGVLSSRDIRPFDRDADGYVRGEGGGFVVLKPLRRALCDGDRVYAVLRGSAVVHAGAGRALVAPSTDAQLALLRTAYEAAGVGAQRVHYIETHGTATPQGDRCEAEAIGAFARARTGGRPISIGSVKANIGHLEAASGVAGLIKTALALYHEYLPATPNCEVPHPEIPFDQLRLSIANRAGAWPSDASRIAGVTSLGLCGTHCHVVVQGRRTRRPSARSRAHGAHLLVLSAATPEALNERVRSLSRWCRSEPPVRLRDVCYTAAVRRTHYAHRLAVVCTSFASCADALDRALPMRDRGAPGVSPKLVFAVASRGSVDRHVYRQLVHRFRGVKIARHVTKFGAPADGPKRFAPGEWLAVHAAQWFCTVGFAPDAILTDEPTDGYIEAALRKAMAREPGDSIGDSPRVFTSDADASALYDGGPVVTVTFGDATALSERFPETMKRASREPSIVLPALSEAASSESLLQVIGRLYCHGFNPLWSKLHGRGGVVSLPALTWHRATATACPDPRDSCAQPLSRHAVAAMIRKDIAAILGSNTVLEDHQPLLAAGLDSLSALELEDRLRRALGVETRILRTLDVVTIAELSERVMRACADRDATTGSGGHAEAVSV